MGEKSKKGITVIIFTILFLPYLQHRFGLIKSGRLSGYYTDAADTDFTFKGWFGGSYQARINDFYNDHIGFRPELLKLNAQIDYTFFQKLDYGGTTLGDNNYLFYTNYIDAYYGRYFAGDKILNDRMVKLKYIQDTLARLGKSCVIVYAPCKAWYYAEYIPASVRRPKGKQNNYKTLKHLGDSLGVNQVDFNVWFLSMKKTAKELLFSRQGIHWTNYGAILAADSLVKYIERERHIHMPHPVWSKVVHTTQPRDPDNDMAVILNLIYPMTPDTFCYPELHYTADSNTTRPKCIYIGDSYVINLIKTEVIPHINSDWQFWYYFKYLINGANFTAQEYPRIINYDWKSELNKSECVIMIYTPMNTSDIGNGFIEEAYKYYYPNK